LPDPFECPIVQGLASRVREHASVARGTMIGTVAGLATSLGDVCTRVGFAVDVGTRWDALAGSCVVKGRVLVVTAVVAVFVLGVVPAGAASTVVVCM